MSAVISEDLNGLGVDTVLDTSNTDATFVFGDPVIVNLAFEGDGAARFTTTGGKCYMYYTFSGRDLLFVRFLIWIDADPPTNTYIATVSSASSRVADMRLNTNRRVAIRDFNNAVDTSPVSLPTGAWSRLEWTLARSGGQRQRLFLGDNAGGTVPDYDSGTVAFTQNTAFTQVTYGMATNATYDFVLDLLAADDADWPVMPDLSIEVSAGAVKESLAVDDQTEVTAYAIGGDGNYFFAWTITSGPDTNLDQFLNPASDYTLFTPSTEGTYVLRCTVTDGESRTGFDEVTVQATANQRIAWALSILVAG